MLHALRVLDYDSVRARLAFHCETSLGESAARTLDPSFDAEVVWFELERTRQAYTFLSEVPAPSLGAARDLRNQIERAAKGGAVAGPDLYQVAELLAALRNFKGVLYNRRAEAAHLWQLAAQFPELKRLEDDLRASLDGSGEVLDSASAELGQLRRRHRTTTSRIIERIQSYTAGKNRELLSDPIYTQRDGRYVVPVRVENRGKIRGIVHDTSGSGQTLFVEPEDVLQLGNTLREVEAAIREEVRRILAELSAKVGAHAGEIKNGIEAAGELDLLLAKARYGFELKGSFPQRWQGEGIVIEGGRHPLLDSETVVPIEIGVGFDSKGLLITGPNTGGKTVAIKTVGLFVLMAQSGMPLPARDVKLGAFSQIWADIGDEQSIQQSLSTFSGHIKNIAEALKHVRSGALVLLDEVGAGTDPAEGAALAKAVLLTLVEKGAFVIASTHYGELKAFAFNTPGFKNASMEFDVKSLRPTYKVLMGSPGASHAMRIAERYGLPKAVVDRALQGLSEDQIQVGKMIEDLELAQRRARISQSEADRRLSEAMKAEEKAAGNLAEADEIRQNARTAAAQEVDQALREIRAESARVFEELKSQGGAAAGAAARERLRQIESSGRALSERLSQSSRREPTAAPGKISRGMNVNVRGYPQPGTVIADPKEGQVLIQMGPLKMSAKLADVSPTTTKPAQTSKAKRNLGFAKAQTASSEIHLRAMRWEDAQIELERFVDDAVLAGLPSIRVIHGKGEGALRKMTQELLRKNPNVERFREGEPAEGGHGVTIAYFK